MQTLDEYDGSMDGIIVYTEVITDRINEEQKLIQSERRFRSIVEGAPDPIFIQTDMKFAYLNPAACKLFGINDPGELIGKPVMERFHPDNYEKIKSRISRLNDMQEPVEELLEQKFIRVDGSEVWVETAGEPITYEGKNGALVFVRDVSEA
ncbi:MAG: PAS domain S-box protein [Melioribacteraceae bacterium]|nr:PAS domain S-box protein [Melioribacteraceae bacterium]